MIMNRLNSELRGHAVSYGLCTQWQGDWQNNKSQQELIGMYIRGIDFCIEHDYPTVVNVQANFLSVNLQPLLSICAMIVN